MATVKYKEHKNPDYAHIGIEMLEYWQEFKIFERSVQDREGRHTFTFFEGPPSANGTPGIHHVMARTVKDIFCRYKTMQGFQVRRKGGWDTHGLPVELQVEKELGITKEDIGKKISIKEYNERCKQTVMKYKHQWDELTQIMGYWVDLEHPYLTYDNQYIESLWSLLKDLFDKGLLYKGYTIQPFSPAAGTGLSSHELNLPGCYKLVKDTSVVAQFELTNTRNRSLLALLKEYGTLYALAWTTTPWTLPANSALAVGESISYSVVKTFNPYTHLPVHVLLATDLVGKYFLPGQEGSLAEYKPGDKKIPFEIRQSLKGSQLIGCSYKQLLPYVQPLYDKENAFRIISGDFVSTDDGTGIVHIAPTFGADDYRVAKAAGVPPITVLDDEGQEVPIVDRQGRFVKQITDFAGMYVKNYNQADETDPSYKSTDVLLSILLKEENKAFKVEKYEHSYPHCWRTDKPILYYPLDSWFVRTTTYRNRMVELNKTIRWMPESTGTGRFGNWLENLVDWNLSRSRYWGTPLPIWVTEDRREVRCIGSIAELQDEVSKSVAAGFMQKPLGSDIDLHRPYVDEIILTSDSGKPMYREPDLIDVWFDSGAMPYAQWHYPMEGGEEFRKHFPADFIAEGVDQTRGWFFTLHALSVLLHDSVAFKNVIANGLVLDKLGNKMSKSKGNVVNPFDTIALYGPDPTRWYMIENAPPWENLKFNTDGIVETQRKFFGTLSNTYSFFAMYANLDAYVYMKRPSIPMDDRSEMDRWISSKVQSLIKEVTDSLDQYDPTPATRKMQEFVVDDLSNWYVRLNRKRFWKPGKNSASMDADKQAAYDTLFECLLTVTQLMAPVAPFYADWLYLQLTSPARSGAMALSVLKESVHLTLWPKQNENYLLPKVERAMAKAQQICTLVHSIRKVHQLKVRQPLSKVLVPVHTLEEVREMESVEEIIRTETNVKELEWLLGSDPRLIKKVKPNFKKLGKVFGPRLKEVSNWIAEMTQEDIAILDSTGFVEMHGVRFTPEDVEISFEDITGWAVAVEGPTTVALDLTVTDALKREGLARDIVNRIQNLRKDMQLEVTDKIKVTIQRYDALLEESVETYKAYISQETQAVALKMAAQLSDAVEVEMDGFTMHLKLMKA
jgi:isoleucyl-tRNA synthetase